MEILTDKLIDVVTDVNCPKDMTIVVTSDGWHVIRGRQHRFFTTDQIIIMKMRVMERIELEAATEEVLDGQAAG